MKDERRFSAVTWNIHSCIGNDRCHDIERVGRVIRALAPDIAALQEVDSRRESTVHLDIYNYLRYQVGEHGHKAWSISGADGHYGQILASRFPLTNRQVHDISLPGREPRKVMDAHAQLPGGAVRVIATHLGLRPGERRWQLEQLREIVQEDLATPAILLGDLNLWRDGRNGHPLSDLFDVRTRHRSFPSYCPLLPLDRIMCRGGLGLESSRTVREASAASDHLPVVACISPAEPARSAAGQAHGLKYP